MVMMKKWSVISGQLTEGTSHSPFRLEESAVIDRTFYVAVL